MNNQVKRALCLEDIYSLPTHSLESSGRYIKALRHSYGLTSNPTEKVKYEYKLTRSLQKHIMLLQENIINSSGKFPNKIVKKETAIKIKNLTSSPIALNEGKYSYVDVDSLRNLILLNKAVRLKKDIVLPVKVKSSDSTYKFNTQIILSKNNILSYASSTLNTSIVTSRLYNPTKISRIGNGIKNNELLEQTKNSNTKR